LTSIKLRPTNSPRRKCALPVEQARQVPNLGKSTNLRYTPAAIQGGSAIASPAKTPAGPSEGAFAVFQELQFRWLFLGNVAFFFAMQGQMLTRTILAWDLTGEATALAFIMPARMAITASVVGPRRMQSAMAFSGAVMNMSRVAGPAIMGLVIAQFSVVAAYVVSSMLYATAITCMLGVKTSRSSTGDKPKPPLLADIASGFSYLRGNRPVLICLAFGLLPMFVAMPFQNLLVMLAEQAWQLGESAVGTLMAIGGIGGVFGSLWIVRRGESARRLRLMVGATLAFGAFLALFAQTPNFYFAMLPLLLANTCASAAQTVNNASIQIMVDDEVRGRMSSLMMMSFGLTPIGVFPMAIAADQVGAANAITGACLFLLLVVSVFVMTSSTLRNLDQTVHRRIGDIHGGHHGHPPAAG